MGETKKLIIQRFVPLPATSLASTLNVLFMRYNEIKTGIEVYNKQKQIIGSSKIAAKKAYFKFLFDVYLNIPRYIN